MWAPQNIHQTHTPHLENKCRHRHTGVHRYIHSQRQSENLGDVSIFLSKWEGLELMNYGHRRKNRKVWRTKLQERDWKAGTTKDNKVADDGRNSNPFLLTIFLAGSNFSEPHWWERQEGATSHHLSQEPCGWQEAVLSCPGHVSHVREEPKTRIKGLRNRASPSSSLLRCWQTLCCLDTGKCPLGAGAGPSTRVLRPEGRAGGRALGMARMRVDPEREQKSRNLMKDELWGRRWHLLSMLWALS